jgi:hypothetical protein
MVRLVGAMAEGYVVRTGGQTSKDTTMYEQIQLANRRNQHIWNLLAQNNLPKSLSSSSVRCLPLSSTSLSKAR